MTVNISRLRQGDVISLEFPVHTSSIGLPSVIRIHGEAYTQQDLDRMNAKLVRRAPRLLERGDRIKYSGQPDTRYYFVTVLAPDLVLISDRPLDSEALSPASFWMYSPEVLASPDGAPIDWEETR